LSAAPGSGTSLYAGSLAPAADGGNTTVTLPWIPLNGTCSRSTTQWTAGLVSGIATCENDSRPSELLATTFTTPPFTAPYAISGPIDATIWISSTAADTQVIATLSDVAPDGASSQITAGTLVASLRALTVTACGAVVADCSLYANGQLIEPWHPYTHASQSALTPGVPTRLEIEIVPPAARGIAGDRPLAAEAGAADPRAQPQVEREGQQAEQHEPVLHPTDVARDELGPIGEQKAERRHRGNEDRRSCRLRQREAVGRHLEGARGEEGGDAEAEHEARGEHGPRAVPLDRAADGIEPRSAEEAGEHGQRHDPAPVAPPGQVDDP